MARGYTPRLRPRRHQVEARQKCDGKPTRPSTQDVFAYLMEMGTGKSKLIVDEFGERAEANDVSDLLLWAPAGCYRNWFQDRGDDELSELHKHMDPEVYERTLVAPWVSGNSAAKRYLESVIKNSDPKRPRALIMNVEAMSSVKAAVAAAKAFVASSRRGVISVVDESPVIKNRKAARTKTINDVAKHSSVAARRILTGLVTPRSPMDLFAQFGFLDERILGFRSYFGFQARYAITRELKIGGVSSPRNPRIIVDYQNLDELKRKIEPYSFRKLKDECLDLPAKVYLPPREVRLHAEQEKVYLQMREFATAQLAKEDYVTATLVLTQRQRLSQILCGHVKDENGRIHDVPEYRTEALLEILEECDGKAIIWTSHDYCVRKIARVLRETYGDGVDRPDAVAQFWGGNAGTRHEDERRFKGDPNCRFMVATPSAGGRGNTWTVAGLCVFYDNSDDLEHRLQAEDRNHRDGLMDERGAKKAVYADLVAPGTIDGRKIANLRKKIDLATIINGDNYKEWLI